MVVSLISVGAAPRRECFQMNPSPFVARARLLQILWERRPRRECTRQHQFVLLAAAAQGIKVALSGLRGWARHLYSRHMAQSS